MMSGSINHSGRAAVHVHGYESIDRGGAASENIRHMHALMLLFRFALLAPIQVMAHEVVCA